MCTNCKWKPDTIHSDTILTWGHFCIHVLALTLAFGHKYWVKHSHYWSKCFIFWPLQQLSSQNGCNVDTLAVYFYLYCTPTLDWILFSSTVAHVQTTLNIWDIWLLLFCEKLFFFLGKHICMLPRKESHCWCAAHESCKITSYFLHLKL